MSNIIKLDRPKLVPMNMRITKKKLTLIDRACEEEGCTRTDFITKSATIKAEEVIISSLPNLNDILKD